MQLAVMPGGFAVCRLATLDEAIAVVGRAAPVFLGVTADEISLVCPSPAVPPSAVAVEDGWTLLKVAGPLDFALTGIIAQLSQTLAAANIPVFVVSTYQTDYLMVKTNRLEDAVKALTKAGHNITAADGTPGLL